MSGSGNEAALAKRESAAVGMPANTMTDLVKAGELLAQSGMFGFKDAGSGFVVAVTCQQQGISLIEFVRTYHIVNGRPSMRADAMLSELRQRGGRHKIVENSVTRAAVEITFEGVTQVFEFTMKDAERTGDCYDGTKLKHNWLKRPDDMLWARCISRAVRRICPEIVSGLYTPEETEDFTDKPARAEPRTITPEVVKERTAKKPRTVTVEPVESTPAPEPELIGDCTTCPKLGSTLDGLPWIEMDTTVLINALNSQKPEMKPGHKAAIRLILDEREKANAEAEHNQDLDPATEGGDA